MGGSVRPRRLQGRAPAARDAFGIGSGARGTPGAVCGRGPPAAPGPLHPRPGARRRAPAAGGRPLPPASGATANGTTVPITTQHWVKIHIEIWIDRLDKNGS